MRLIFGWSDKTSQSGRAERIFSQSPLNLCARFLWTTLAAVAPPNVAAAPACSHWTMPWPCLSAETWMWSRSMMPSILLPRSINGRAALWSCVSLPAYHWRRLPRSWGLRPRPYSATGLQPALGCIGRFPGDRGHEFGTLGTDQGDFGTSSADGAEGTASLS